MLLPKYNYQQEIELCTWDEDLTPITIYLPDPPDLKKIENYGIPKDKQLWTIPDYNSRKKWLYSLSDYELDKFEDQELERIYEKGHFFFNNGKIEYLTPLHYFYMKWWYIYAENGYPEYRKRDRNYFYAWKFGIEDNPYVLGMNYMKHRREGATSRSGCTNYHTAIRKKGATCGIQSKTEIDAGMVFRKHIVRPWKKLPDFLKPIWDGTTNPKKSLEFTEPGERVTAKSNRRGKYNDTVLESRIDYLNSNEEAYDGQEVAFYHGDEIGKTLTANVYTRWTDYVRLCLKKGTRKVGNALHTSTVAEMDKGGINFRELWNDSKIVDAKTRTTKTGLINYFCPAYDGFEGFIDQYGDSVIEAPTPEQLKFLRKKYPEQHYNPKEGAKAYLENIRETFRRDSQWAQLSNEKRLNPFTVKEAFRSSGNDCAFNREYLNLRLEAVEHKQHLIWIQGNLEWEERKLPNGQVQTRDTRVIFKPSSNGRFFLHALWWNPTRDDLNRTRTRWDGLKEPVNNESYSSGIDTYDHKHVKSQNPSKGALIGSIKYDPILDPPFKPVKDWKTNRQIVRYCERPAGGPYVFYEDMIKWCFLTGAETLIETNKPGILHYFEERGYQLFIALRPDSAKGITKSSQQDNELGVPGSELMNERRFEYINQYVEDYYELLDDKLLIEDLLEADIKDMTPHDLTIAFGQDRLLAKKSLKFERKMETGVPILKKYKVSYR